ncbi:phage tail length tape measure family protein [Coralloluteibacterium thermophilus]|uniref:Phage tail length tape measure family protein n=1 Tax=Coralloluteibacterium thermophilum TaxID=2707049 RepID=A0ABV9NL71_9GAMM
MDIAQLGYAVDSSALLKGEQALERTAEAAEKAGGAAAKLERDFESLQRAAGQASGGIAASLADQEDRYRQIAQRGLEYAESMRSANLSERALAEAAREAAAGIDMKAAVMARAGTEQERMAERVARLQAAEARAAQETAAAARATQLRELNLRKLIGQIDPTVAKLERLASLEQQLERASELGALSPEVFAQYQAKLDAVRAATLNVGAASDITTKSLGRLNLQSVEAQQSVAALVRAVASGQWGQAQSSITSLTARTGALGGAFTGVGLAVGGVLGGLATFGVMAGKGHFEARRLEGVIIGMGNSAGVTTGQMLALRNEIGHATRDYGGATDAINRLLLSGKATGDVLEGVVRSAAQLSRLTGQSITAAASEIASLAEGGDEALTRLNDRYNFLTRDTYLHIEALRQQKGDLDANRAAVAELERVMTERSEKMVEQAGYVERAWLAVTRAFKSAVQEAKDFGRTDLDRQIVVLERQISALARSAEGYYDGGAYLNSLRDQLSALQDQKAELEAAAAAEAQRSQHQRELIETERELKKAREEAEAAHDRRLVQMDRELAKQREINEVNAIFNALAVDDARHFDGSRERMLAEIERKYAAVAQRATVARERVSEEERAAQRLLQQYQSAEASLARQIALYGQAGRAAAMAYDTAHGALAGLDATQKSVLMDMAQWLDFLDEMRDIEGLWAEIEADHKKVMGQVEQAYGGMSEHARQAARNMQSHFADFLFDPFADGTKSMGRAFSDTLRRMLAEAAASKIFGVIGTAMTGYTGAGAGFVNAFGGVLQGGGGREYGGSVNRNRAYRTGERNKPELLTTPSGQYLIPGENGRVDPIRAAQPANRAGMGSPQVNIHLHGAPEGATATARQNDTGGFDVEVMLNQIENRMASRIAQGTGSMYVAQKARFGLKDRV